MPIFKLFAPCILLPIFQRRKSNVTYCFTMSFTIVHGIPAWAKDWKTVKRAKVATMYRLRPWRN